MNKDMNLYMGNILGYNSLFGGDFDDYDLYPSSEMYDYDDGMLVLRYFLSICCVFCETAL